ncbi:DEAD/DEAH box helicase [Methanoplanus sp. FWC-SCC4]|uniref:DEAD/DEAH box helicase n=1 Tax=Methanochimaera problematica TaxID=2609417 RepID=A0AA97FBM9_9EURY|nr:DEAD/DEAH box helicase [Methanoplanus sp. FWC-SCC4]WOF15572.1 DEAD/DEAH box helicase [Methanoplanus sp. FWC-SCC4]
MKIVINPQRGSYKLFFYDKRSVVGYGIVELTKTSKGVRPKNYLFKWLGEKHAKKTPTKELISQLRNADAIRLTIKSKNFEAFLADLQIGFGYLKVCRTCMLEDRITVLKGKNSVKYGHENICLHCAKNELRREMGYIGGLGGMSSDHLEKLLELYMDLDKVLSMVQPERLDLKNTIFDTLEAHKLTETKKISELPLPEKFKESVNVEKLMPVQQLCVDAGLLEGKDQLVVAATASGKTFIGEMAGVKNYIEKRGNMLFLVPLVALANQKYSRFTERYPFLDVSLKTGVSRLNLPETRVNARRSIRSGIIVGTYEGIDHYLRCGKVLSNIGTVVIDEVQTLEDKDRGHRLDGLIARLKYIAPQAQFLYLSATIGSPHLLAKKLNSELVTYNERPVPLERHLIFLERKQKIPMIKSLVTQEFRKKSSKGYKGQTIVFTNSRARCHEVSDAIGSRSEAYHAGLTAKERRNVEKRFEKGEISSVVTTAALAAGVDFPASQVIFDSLAMGIEWLTVQDFYQMIGRAGRPDYHDMGKAVILAEPGGSYSRDSKITEEEVSINLLKGEMDEVAPVYDMEGSSEEYAAHVVVSKGDEKAIDVMCKRMVGEIEDIYPVLRKQGIVAKKGGKVELSPYGRVMAEHFIGIDRLNKIKVLVKKMKNPVDIVAELNCSDNEDLENKRKK